MVLSAKEIKKKRKHELDTENNHKKKNKFRTSHTLFADLLHENC